ncbi:MAG: NAD(P)/FAD-dependent oxidoreductase [Oscillospiraceae bacterium]
MKSYDIAIIGKGPAGVSASLYAVRGGGTTLVIGKDSGTVGKCDKIDNYYGFRETISGEDLMENGIYQAERLGVDFLYDEVLALDYNGDFTVKCKTEDITAKTVLIATGSSRNTPRIDGIKDFEGKGVSYCAVCDAFFYRGKDICVIGNGEYALHEAMELKEVVKSVTILTDGKPIAFENVSDDIKVIDKKIKLVSGEEIVSKVTFDDDSTLDIQGIFIAIGVAGSVELAKKIGAQVDNNKIIINESMATNIPGLYAAGDCTGGMLQVAKAVYQGATAGGEMLKTVRKLKIKK